jgi:ATP-dependent helicase HrpB
LINEQHYDIQKIMQYPIEECLPEVIVGLHRNRRIVITAPTGSGKSTVLPTHLHNEFSGQIWLIQPRRAATVLVANRIAQLLGCQIGTQVGYHIRFDRKYNKRTNVIVMTEGIFIRRVQTDPFLENVSIVILDEFHERSINLDLSMGFLKDIQETNENICVIYMSATLDPSELQSFYNEKIQVIQSTGRIHPVSIEYSKLPIIDLNQSIVSCIVNNLSNKGNLLTFLPGKREIITVAKKLSDHGIQALQLHGQQTTEQQRLSLQLKEIGKVILSTNIAESSVTIPNINCVIDSGLQKRPREEDGIPYLDVVPISQDSADQRAGRAGRTQSGVCHRLWTRNSQQKRPIHRIPEVSYVPLEQACVQILLWGENPNNFSWLTPPPNHRLQSALRNLHRLGIYDGNSLTPFGRKVANIPLPPKLGALLLQSSHRTFHTQVIALVTLLSEGIPQGDNNDPEYWIDLLINNQKMVPRKWKKAFHQFISINESSNKLQSTSMTELLSIIMPERIARRIASNRYLCGSGKERKWDSSHIQSDWIFIVSVMGNRIFSALPIDSTLLATTELLQHKFDSQQQKVFCWKEEKLGEILIAKCAHPIDIDKASEILYSYAVCEPDKALSIDSTCQSLLNRIEFAATKSNEISSIKEWRFLLRNLCVGKRSFSELRAINLTKEIQKQFTWKQKQILQKQAPTKYTLPNGRQVPLDYPLNGAPILASRIQRLFSLKKHPMLGETPLMIHLLAPNGRIQQQTTNIESFWINTYPQIRKELRGRYPKHDWPDPKDL